MIGWHWLPPWQFGGPSPWAILEEGWLPQLTKCPCSMQHTPCSPYPLFAGRGCRETVEDALRAHLCHYLYQYLHLNLSIIVSDSRLWWAWMKRSLRMTYNYPFCKVPLTKWKPPGPARTVLAVKLPKGQTKGDLLSPQRKAVWLQIVTSMSRTSISTFNSSPQQSSFADHWILQYQMVDLWNPVVDFAKHASHTLCTMRLDRIQKLKLPRDHSKCGCHPQTWRAWQQIFQKEERGWQLLALQPSTLA